MIIAGGMAAQYAHLLTYGIPRIVAAAALGRLHAYMPEYMPLQSADSQFAPDRRYASATLSSATLPKQAPLRRKLCVGTLVGVCVAAWLAAAIAPYDPQAWLLEQVASGLCIALLLWAVFNRRRRVQFSLWSLTGLTVLFVAHTAGTHYTYSLTPYNEVLQQLTGFSLNGWLGFERNNYDRLVHLLFGVATALPMFEFLRQHLHLNANWSWLLAGSFNLSASTLYELLEWAAAWLFADGAGVVYLGAQGYIWDAQADMALALAGFLAVYTVYGIRSACAALMRSA